MHRAGTTLSYWIHEPRYKMEATLEVITVSKLMHLVDIDFIPLEILRRIWRETIKGLNSSHMNDAAHPKLDSSTIGIKIIPRPEPGKCPSVHVKLEESAIKRGAKTEDYIRELVSFGNNVLRLCVMDEENAVHCVELTDLLWRIQQAGRPCVKGKPHHLTVVGDHNGLSGSVIVQKLAVELIDNYIKRPASILELPPFWSEKRHLDLLVAVDDWLEVCDGRKKWKSTSPNAYETFRDRLMALEVKDLMASGEDDWKIGLNKTMLDKGCQHPISNARVENSVIGFIRCIRHCHTRYRTVTTEERKEIYGGVSNCFSYVRKIAPAIFMHVYTCVQLSFEEFAAEFESADELNHFRIVFSPFLTSGPSI